MSRTSIIGGSCCVDGPDKGRETIKRKFRRWKRNARYIYQRARYGFCESDVWSIDVWFLKIMPAMLQYLKETTDGYPSVPGELSHALVGSGAPKDVDDAGMKVWAEVLDEMIFLLKEANEETCSRANPYEESWEEAYKDFSAKYGDFGEKLKTEEQKEREEKEGLHTLYMLGDVPEYKEIDELYYKESKAIEEYRNDCKDKALELFSKWFWNLWD